MNEINTRFEIFFKSLKMKMLQFDNQIGLARGMTGKILNGTGLTSETASKIFSLYPTLNANWLFKGEGPMYLSDSPNQLIGSTIDYGTPTPNLPLVVTVDNTGRENILMVNSKAYAGYTTNVQEKEYLRKLPAFGMPLPEFRNGTYRCFQASGQSMEPTIWNGDWLIGEYLDDWPSRLRDGYIYIIVTQDTLLVKRILNRLHQGKLIIQSDNEAYPTQVLEPEEVQEVWYLKAKLSFQFPNTRFEVLKEISNLKADVELLRREIGLGFPARKGTS